MKPAPNSKFAIFTNHYIVFYLFDENKTELNFEGVYRYSMVTEK